MTAPTTAQLRLAAIRTLVVTNGNIPKDDLLQLVEDLTTCGHDGRTMGIIRDALLDHEDSLTTEQEEALRALVADLYDGPPDGDAWSGGFAANH